MILILVVVFAAGSLFAGEGKSCDTHKTKAVKLTGTISTVGDATIFRVANSDKSFTVCHKTKAELTKLGEDGGTLQVTGKVVACDEADGEELIIETAKKI
jgi:hypothetical protein